MWEKLKLEEAKNWATDRTKEFTHMHLFIGRLQATSPKTFSFVDNSNCFMHLQKKKKKHPTCYSSNIKKSNTTHFHWLVLIDKSLWQEVLTKEAIEFGDSLSTIKDIMTNKQSKHCRIIFEQHIFSHAYLWANFEKHC